MLRVKEINSLAELQPYRLLWRKLLGETRGATFFQSPTWLEAYWHAFVHPGRLRVLIVYAGDEALGIVPLVVCHRRTRLGNCRVLTYPVLRTGLFYGPIGPNPTASLLEALRHIRQTPRDWDVLDLGTIDPTVDCGRTEHALQRMGLSARRTSTRLSMAVRFESDWHTYWASRSEQCRENVCWAESNLAAKGNVEYVHYRPGGTAADDDDPRWDLYSACVEMASQAKGSLFMDAGPLANPATESFVYDLHHQAVEAGAVDLHLLKVDDTPVAFSYGYCVHGHTVALESDFYSGTAFQGAGAVLKARLLQRCCSLGDRRYTFAAGSLRHLHRWQTDMIAGERYTYFAHTPRMQLLRFTQSLVGLG